MILAEGIRAPVASCTLPRSDPRGFCAKAGSRNASTVPKIKGRFWNTTPSREFGGSRLDGQNFEATGSERIVRKSPTTSTRRDVRVDRGEQIPRALASERAEWQAIDRFGRRLP